MKSVRIDRPSQLAVKQLKVREVSERTRDENILAPNGNHHPSPSAT